MAFEKQYPKGVPYRIPRPRGDAATGALVGAGLLGLLTGGAGWAALGGLAGSTIANQPPSFDSAIRAYLANLGLRLIGVYRYGPRMVKVTFEYAPSKFWLISSRAPDHPQLTQEDIDDWLYGDLIENQLPAAQAEISSYLNQ